MINVINSTNFYNGLLIFDYDEEKDSFAIKKNEIIIPKNTKIPVSKTIKVYPFKNVAQNKVFLKIGITQSASNETDPDFVSVIWYGRIHLDSKHPLDQPLELIYSLDSNGMIHAKINNPLIKKEITIDLTKRKLEDAIDLELLETSETNIKDFIID